MVLTSGGVIEELGAAESFETLTYETGDIVLGQPDLKAINEVEFYGSGEIAAVILVDGVQKATKSIDMDGMLRERTLKMKANTWGRAVRVRVTGAGEVKEIRMAIEKVGE